jgi:ATP-dependent DNA ligase
LLGAYLGEKVYPLTRIGTGFTEEQLAEFTELFKEGIVEEKPK